MNIDRSKMSVVESASLELHSMYRKQGYSRYKMEKFEEYELYVKNRDYVESGSIITFSDSNGKLMALKPDLTLSIIKNYKYTPGFVQKMFYSENIYRISKQERSHKEIMQTGIECMGDLDTYQITEVIILAAQSLKTFSEDYVLQISDMAIIEELLACITDEEQKKALVNCIGEKNPHGLAKLCAEYGVGEAETAALIKLIGTYGSYDKVRESLEEFALTDKCRESLETLDKVFAVVKMFGLSDKIKLDFSMVNDMTYYNNILFQGFVNGIPQSVLKGGQYDRLLARNGKKGKAIGFAVYLDYLDRLPGEEIQNDADIVLIYGEEDDPAAVYEAALEIVDGSESIIIEKAVPENFRYGRLAKMEKGKVIWVD